VNCRCGQEFCWICLESHNNHSFGSGKSACNRFDETKAAKMSDERKALARYMHYFLRFDNHKKSLQWESKLVDVQVEVVKMLSKIFRTEEAEKIVHDAVAALHKARVILSWTYCFGNYLEASNQKLIFENNQEDLERMTEQLSGFLESTKMIDSEKDFKERLAKMRKGKWKTRNQTVERSLLESNPAEYHQQLINKASYCESRSEILVAHVKEGYQKGEWQFREGLTYSGMIVQTVKRQKIKDSD